MEKVNCICGKNRYKVLYIFKKKNYLFRIVKCTSCNLIYMNPRPKPAKIMDFYKKDYYYDDRLYDPMNLIKAKLLYKEIKNYLLNGSVLDIGCSKGFLLNFLKEKKLQLHGIEPSKDAVKFAWDNFKIKITHGYFDSVMIKNNYYENIIAIDIIEHFINPPNILKKIYQILKKNGVLIIETPNIASLYFVISKKRWMGFDLPFHIYYFTPATLTKLLKSVGFSKIVVETSHFNIFSREGFIRSKGYGSFIIIRSILRLFGIDPDIVVNKVNKNIINHQLKTQKKFNFPRLNFLDKLEIFINRPINYLFAKKLLLGDAIRIIAYK